MPGFKAGAWAEEQQGGSTRHPRQERPHLAFQQLDQGRLHVVVVIRNAQHDHPLALQVALELLGEAAPMDRLHHEDQIGPRQLFRTNRNLGRIEQTRRIAFQSGVPGEHLLGRGAAQTVLRAEEQDTLHAGAPLSVLVWRCFWVTHPIRPPNG